MHKRSHLVLSLRYMDIFVYIVKGFGAAGSVGLGVKVGFCIVSMTTQVWNAKSVCYITLTLVSISLTQLYFSCYNRI